MHNNGYNVILINFRLMYKFGTQDKDKFNDNNVG